MSRINNDLYRTLVLTILAGLSVLVVAFARDDVYSKETIDAKFETRDQDIADMKSDVQWLVRKQGGVPHAESRPDSNTP